MRKVTEADFRIPEFRDAKAEDYEIRNDGHIVRRDRWEMGIRRIASIVGMSGRDFEIDDVVRLVRQHVEPLKHCAAGRDGECGHIKCPQLIDKEPASTGRHCPLDNDCSEDW